MNASDKPNDKQPACLQRLVRPFFLLDSDTLVVAKRGGGEREIPPNKWWINRRTPVGEDAVIYERMPHSGRRWLDERKIIAVKRFVPNVQAEPCPPKT